MHTLMPNVTHARPCEGCAQRGLTRSKVDQPSFSQCGLGRRELASARVRIRVRVRFRVIIGMAIRARVRARVIIVVRVRIRVRMSLARERLAVAKAVAVMGWPRRWMGLAGARVRIRNRRLTRARVSKGDN